jgi:hypothetical protein
MSQLLKVGDKVYIQQEKKPYKVICRDDRYIICTKPMNLKKTVLYFIIDIKEKWMAPDNMLFCSGYETKEDCKERLKELQNGTIALSFKRGIKLDLDII